MKRVILSLLIIFSCIIPVFSQEKTQIEVREFQTRTYDTKDYKMVMKAVLNVLQDQEFIVNNANTELGFISANKEFDRNDKNIDFKKEFGLTKFKSAMLGCTTVSTEATVNISSIGDQVKVRVNFKRKLLNYYSSVVKVDDVKDQTYYQDFFAKVDKGIFIQKEKI